MPDSIAEMHDPEVAPGPVTPRSFSRLHQQLFQVVGRAPVVFVLLPALAWLPVDLAIEAAVRAGGGSGSQLQLSMHLNALSGAILGPWMTAVQLCALRALAQGRAPALGQALREGTREWGRVFGVSFFLGLRVVIGLLLGVLPGLYLLFRYSVATPAAVFEGKSDSSALQRSSLYTSGHLWGTALRLCGILLLYIPLCFAPMLFATEDVALRGAVGRLPFNVLLGLFTIMQTLVYLDLRGARFGAEVPAPLGTEPPAPGERQWGRRQVALGGLIGWGTAFGSFVLLFVIYAGAVEAGREAWQRQDLPAAAAHLERALKWLPNDHETRALLGRLLAAQGQPEAAERNLARAITDAKGKGDYRLERARVLLQLGRSREAREELAAARRLGTADPQGLDTLAGQLGGTDGMDVPR